MITVEVKASSTYDIQIAPGLLGQLGEQVRTLHPKAGTVAIVTDETVGGYYLETVESALEQAGFRVVSHAIPAGELSKNGMQYLALLEWLSESQITRGDVIVALGGGVWVT
jgi:3-dehydroquinate synthase